MKRLLLALALTAGLIAGGVAPAAAKSTVSFTASDLTPHIGERVRLRVSAIASGQPASYAIVVIENKHPGMGWRELDGYITLNGAGRYQAVFPYTGRRTKVRVRIVAPKSERGVSRVLTFKPGH